MTSFKKIQNGQFHIYSTNIVRRKIHQNETNFGWFTLQIKGSLVGDAFLVLDNCFHLSVKIAAFHLGLLCFAKLLMSLQYIQKVKMIFWISTTNSLMHSEWPKPN